MVQHALIVFHGTWNGQRTTPDHLLAQVARAAYGRYSHLGLVQNLLVLPGPGGSHGAGAADALVGGVLGYGGSGCEMNALQACVHTIRWLVGVDDAAPVMALVGHSRGGVSASYTTEQWACLVEVLVAGNLDARCPHLFAGLGARTFAKMGLADSDDALFGASQLNAFLAHHGDKTLGQWLQAQLEEHPQLGDKMRALRFKVFLHDPVPGPSSRSARRYATLAANVSWACVAIQEGDKRTLFNANTAMVMTLADPRQTVFETFRLPGCHTAGIQTKTTDPGRYPPLAHTLLADELLRFLAGCGLAIASLPLHHYGVVEEGGGGEGGGGGGLEESFEVVGASSEGSGSLESSMVMVEAVPDLRPHHGLLDADARLRSWQALLIARKGAYVRPEFDEHGIQGLQVLLFHRVLGFPEVVVARQVAALFPHWFDACFQAGIQGRLAPYAPKLIESEFNDFCKRFPVLFEDLRQHCTAVLDPKEAGFGQVMPLPWTLILAHPPSEAVMRLCRLPDRLLTVLKAVEADPAVSCPRAQLRLQLKSAILREHDRLAGGGAWGLDALESFVVEARTEVRAWPDEVPQKELFLALLHRGVPSPDRPKIMIEHAGGLMLYGLGLNPRRADRPAAVLEASVMAAARPEVDAALVVPLRGAQERMVACLRETQGKARNLAQVWWQQGMRRHVAAVRIQRWVRGRRAQRLQHQVRVQQLLQWLPLDRQRRMFFGRWREFIGTRRTQRQSATAIQALWRGVVGRRHFRLRVASRWVAERAYRQEAAVRVQVWWRARLAHRLPAGPQRLSKPATPGAFQPYVRRVATPTAAVGKRIETPSAPVAGKRTGLQGVLLAVVVLGLGGASWGLWGPAWVSVPGLVPVGLLMGMAALYGMLCAAVKPKALPAPRFQRAGGGFGRRDAPRYHRGGRPVFRCTTGGLLPQGSRSRSVLAH